MDGGIVYEGKTKNGQDFIIRYPKIEDLEKLLDYINTLSREKTFIRYQGEQLTLEEERQYLEKELKQIYEKKAIMLLSFVDENLVGDTTINLGTLSVNKHIGGFGISVSKEFRGQGIGKILMSKVLEEAENNLEGLRLIILGSFETNTVAIDLYKEFGFIQYARLPEAFNHKSKYIAEIKMYKKIR